MTNTETTPTHPDAASPPPAGAARETTETRYTTHHMCVDIRGTLMQSDRQLKGCWYDDAGRLLSPREARLSLMDELAKGRRVLPVGGPCEGFSYETGCPGHPSPSPAEAR